jgi:hypothetical protein
MLRFIRDDSDTTGDRSRTGMSWLRFFSLVLLLLLPPNSFAQAHLWKLKPFRAFDTGHSGGDHICDLRRDSNGDGRPDRLGDYVTVSGTVIAEPSTYETGGWLFWVRQGSCGMLVYGEEECLTLCDSVEVRGRLRRTNGNYFFPETGVATLGDLAIENEGVSIIGESDDYLPIAVSSSEFSSCPKTYGGNLICVSGCTPMTDALDGNGDLFAWFCRGCDSILVYLDADTGCTIDPGRRGCYSITGIVTRMKTPPGFASSPSWCLAPRHMEDIVTCGCNTAAHEVSWGSLKTGLALQD